MAGVVARELSAQTQCAHAPVRPALERAQAPEVARPGTFRAAADGAPPLAVDVYGLGVIAWELAHVHTGDDAPAADAGDAGGDLPSSAQGVFAMGSAPLRPYMSNTVWFRRRHDFEAEVSDHVPRAFADAVSACLAVDPQTRPSAEEAQAEEEEGEEGVDAAAGADAGEEEGEEEEEGELEQDDNAGAPEQEGLVQEEEAR